ncbi:hypothetical protein EV2_041554 [Malus domestica]
MKVRCKKKCTWLVNLHLHSHLSNPTRARKNSKTTRVKDPTSYNLDSGFVVVAVGTAPSLELECVQRSPSIDMAVN